MSAKEAQPPAAPAHTVHGGVLDVTKNILSESLNKLWEKASQRKLVAEAFGTFLLVFVVGCNIMAAQQDDNHGVFAAVSIGSVLMILVYSLGPVSGACFNPAVSIAVMTAGKLDIPLGLLYILVQLLAGIIAANAFSALYGAGVPFGPKSDTGAELTFSVMQVLLVEFLFTFMLCFTVLNTACCKEGNQYFGLAIGFVIVAGGNAAGWISGGAFNPAVGIGLDVSDMSAGFGWSLPYVFAQCVGGAVAAYAFRWMRPTEYGEESSPLSFRAVYGRYVAEFIGTFFLVLTVGLNVLQGYNPDIPAEEKDAVFNDAAVFSIGASLMVMIYSIGNISGGHLNPAVTIAIFCTMRNKISPKDAINYIIAQVAGGLFGGTVYVYISGKETFPLGPYEPFSWLGVVVAEMTFTCLLCYVVLSVATVTDMSHSKDIFALAIGFSVVAGGYSVGGISGACFNPAASIAIDATYGFIKGGFWRCIPYAFIQGLGGVLAALIFRITHCEEFDEEKLASAYRQEELAQV